MTTKATLPDPETIAIEALQFVAGEQTLLDRFFAVTGLQAATLRQAASEPGFLAGVLDFILAHEPTLMQFSQHSGIPPEAVAAARRGLPAGNDRHLTST